MISKARAILKKYYGFDNFRPLQEEIISEVLAKKDVLVLMPTGGGKSVCYQVPALLTEGICLVISPLISLMKDQVDALRANGIPAAFLNSTQSPAQQESILQDCREEKIRLLYVSPEKMISDAARIAEAMRIALIAVDEAHCISSWGHDFRPEYTQLGSLRDRFAAVPFIALTATADKVTRRDISEQLHLADPRLFISSFDRKNLDLEVRIGLKPKQKLQEIEDFILERPDQSGIIYCLSRKSCEEVAQKLRGAGINAGFYHAGMEAPDRELVQEDFLNDKLQVVCATIAFGMGIDKSNVRWVIHYNLPKNMEGYYQEIGRAGRDGLPSETRLYYSYADVMMLTKFASEGPQAGVNLEKLKRIQHYAEADSCRRRILLSYFSETLAGDCGSCDVCRLPRKHFDGTQIVQKALSAISRTGEKEGSQMIIDVLRGSNRAEVVSQGYHTLKTHGAGADIGGADWQRYLMQMLNTGILEIAYDESFALKITDEGREILFGKKKARLTVLQALMPQGESKEKGRKIAAAPMETMFNNLRKVRQQFAVAENVPAYIIFSDATLRAMAETVPENTEEMMQVPGVGEHKFARYGRAFLEAIAVGAGKKKKGDTHLETLSMFREGQSPEEIAAARGLSPVTIYSHIAQLYETGKVDSVADFVTDDEVNEIASAVQKVGSDSKLKPLFDHLGEQVPFHKIRLALAVLKRTGNTSE